MAIAVAPASIEALERRSTVREYVLSSRWPLLAVAGLLGLTYASNFKKLFTDWGIDENYSHGYIVPVVFAVILWQRRKELADADVGPRWWGALIVAAGLLQLALGRLAAENFVAHTSLVVVLAGTVIYLLGMPVLRLVAFPIVWLLFMIPIPAIIFYAITFPLQLLASRLGAGILDIIGVPNLREGNVISLPNYSMGVVEACSGIRGLISLLTMAVLLGHFKQMKMWQRIALMIAAVPIELAVNALRVASTGIIGNYFGQRYAEGFVHTFYGWVLFMISLALLLAVGSGLGRVGKMLSRQGSAA